MTSIQTVAISLINLFLLVLFVQAVLSWFPGGRTASVQQLCQRVTEPVVGPIRRVLPPVRLGGVGLDLSFLVVFLGGRLVLVPLIASL
jgi:YggT family protein